jgi:predicted heme/steroid binding protein
MIVRRALTFLTVLVALLASTGSALAYSLSNPAPGFGPDQYQNLISNNQFTASDMSAGDISAFMKKQGVWSNRNGGVSWLADYTIPEYQTVPYKYNDGSGNCTWGSVSVRQYYDTANEPLYGMDVATLIAQKSLQYHIAAQVILATLEKESTAISRTSPQSSAVEMWLLGFGWNDTMASCGYNQTQALSKANAYGGVGQQIAYAMSSLFGLRKWYDQSASTYSTPFTSSDGASIVPGNQATKALYTYTPYVYNGNYNFWLFTNQWFTPPVYQPTGLAFDSATGTVYVIDEGAKYAVTGAGFTGWNFSWNNVHVITPSEQSLPYGGLWTQLVLGSDSTVYYMDNGKKRPLTSARLMDRYGFSWGDVVPRSDTILAKVPYGLPMHELLLPTGDGTVYLATAGTLYPVSGTVYNDSWKFSWADTARVPGYVVYNLPVGQLMSNLVIADGGDGTAYFIDNGKSYPLSGAVAQAWGFDLNTIRRVGPNLLAEKDSGGNLTAFAREINGDGTVYLIKAGKKAAMSGSYFRSKKYSFGDIREISGAQLNLLPTGATLR